MPSVGSLWGTLSSGQPGMPTPQEPSILMISVLPGHSLSAGNETYTNDTPLIAHVTPTPGGFLVVKYTETYPSPEPMYSLGPESTLQSSMTVYEYTGSTVYVDSNSPDYSDIFDREKRPMKSKEAFYNRVMTSVCPIRTEKKAGLVGLEIECEGTKLFNTPFKYWTCHEDGSLRSYKGSPPVEYVLREPLDPPELMKALNYLDQKLKEAGSSVHLSSRTSVHVHINVQKMTLRELYCFILLYMIFEEVLVDWSGPERAGNLFCLRAKDSEYYIQMLESVLKDESFRLWKEDFRYSACNVASVPKFGSLEFRSLRGTVDMGLIETWVSVLLHLREKSLTYDNPVDIVEDFNRLGPLPFFTSVFDKTELRNLFSGTKDLSGKLWDGLRMMRDVAYSCKWNPPLKKTQDEPEEKEEVRNDFHGHVLNIPGVHHEDTVDTPFGEKRVFRRGRYDKNCSYTVKDSIDGEVQDLILPAFHYGYFTMTDNGHWYVCDVREED